MPKILPLIGALLTIAAAIGWNTIRYPVVWEMVGPAADSSPLASAAAPSAAAQPAQTNQEEPALPETPKTGPEPAVAAAEPPSPPALAEAKDDAAAEKRGAGCQPAHPDAEEKKPLAVIPASCGTTKTDSQPAPPDEVKANAASPGADDQPASPDVRRLPPLDAEVPPPSNANSAALPAGAIPIYPQTDY
jgi:hypothetical protein